MYLQENTFAKSRMENMSVFLSMSHCINRPCLSNFTSACCSTDGILAGLWVRTASNDRQENNDYASKSL